MSNVKDETAASVLLLMGLPNTETNRSQLELLLMSFEKYVERNEEYKDLWKEGGTPDSIHHLNSKLARLRRLDENASALAHGTANFATFMDTALDLMNYAGFAIRNKRAGR